MAIAPHREVVVLGVGLHPFGRFPYKDLPQLAREAVVQALGDAGARWKDIQIAYFGHVYYQGMSLGEVTLRDLGLTGVPIINVENACSSGSTAFWQAFWGIATGLYDMALAFGAEKVPRGPVTVTAEDSPERLIGTDHMMAGYALRTRKYMEDYGAPIEAIAQVSVKAHDNAALNPYAQYNKTFTLAEVLESRPVADPLTLYQCCPTSEGASAAVLCARDALGRLAPESTRHVTIRGAALTSGTYSPRGADHPALNPDKASLAAQQAYEMAGLGPDDVEVVQVPRRGHHRRDPAAGGYGDRSTGRRMGGHQGRPHRYRGRHPHQYRRRPAGHGPSLRRHGGAHGPRDRHPAAGRGRGPPGRRPWRWRASQSGASPLLRGRRRNHRAYSEDLTAEDVRVSSQLPSSVRPWEGPSSQGRVSTAWTPDHRRPFHSSLPGVGVSQCM